MLLVMVKQRSNAYAWDYWMEFPAYEIRHWHSPQTIISALPELHVANRSSSTFITWLDPVWPI